MGKYDDMLNMPHPVSPKHLRMAMQNRAAQFCPFAALTGYQSMLRETERLTDRRIELSEDERSALDERLHLVAQLLSTEPVLSITYFKPDDRKEGGAYLTVTGVVKKLDEFEKNITLADGTRIPIGEIFSMDGDLFAGME